MMADGVKTFLSSVGMEHYLNMFQTRGYDDESDIPHLTVSDLQNIGINDPIEIVIILKAAHSYKQSSEYDLFRWLRDHGLAHYFEGFVQSGLTLLSEVAQLNLPDEDLYDELEITLPGHQRRLERAVSGLRKRQRKESWDAGDRDLVTEGWWGFPTYLPNAKYPFLCVQATIKSTRHSATPKSIDFMVDSGSDVSTLREDIIQDLNLESITTVRSCGVYGSQRTTMYRAYLTIGDNKLQIEIIGSSYDSLGSRVLRHFNHRIDSTRHRWLRATGAATSQHSSGGNRLSTVSSEGGEPEAETVSVFSDQERRLPSTSGTQLNISDGHQTNCENSAAGVGDDGGGGALNASHSGAEGASDPHWDESDSAWFSSQHLHKPAQPQTVTYRKRARKDMNDDDKRLNSADEVYQFGDSSAAQFDTEGNPVTASHVPVPFSPNHPWPERSLAVAALGRASPRTSSHQIGHLKLSGNGTLSLSFGSERQSFSSNTSQDGH